ncbi:LPD29 domain-containing protein [Pseudomonas asuensis]|uniref:Large polyvalent protein associated domain-containing protein n=1 Tax=Pseudomonas asuensis TaxID=1825787 RepID=A0ABQ2H1B9_9PSED|nr:LPD29 domain-containing protein [Pseudomonas asuensis]GGM25977.1 hypothetical protein GCM10009425_40930 [Pseudomonas asuensis]
MNQAHALDTIVTGQRVRCSLPMCGDGLIYKMVRDNASCLNVRSISKDARLPAMSRRYYIVFFNGHLTDVHEAMLNTPQWSIYASVASAEEIRRELENAQKVKADKIQLSQAAESKFNMEVQALLSDSRYMKLTRADSDPYNGKAAAANIRKQLAKTYPDVKFSVRKASGDAIAVQWTDGPTTSQVNTITSQYVSQRFDPDTRHHVFNRTAWSAVFGGIAHVRLTRTKSDALMARAIDAVFTKYRAELADISIPTVNEYRSGHTNWIEVPVLNKNLQHLISEVAGSLAV